ncbi:nitroreductase family deazaflavin-dependent oxidoreductase [Streptomyces longispororuber]|uniref:nitroreductase family deazaflavin-dependent oxidoreductase n=1 Tax=Streptomyces longispororuber TaxID=68230 RepID=UPI0021093E85|nr:nitroreductase family deazaflavin-dependent oxidoreductase [Streptomyces longispororuber]MCQ4209013.1 nitroreductase family deazaflavin-dependent oxidoreductase [Streptomyces longispororuber]
MADQDTDVVISPTGWVADQARTYEESGGTKGTTIQGVPCLLLDYQGRRSGQWRRTVLIYGRDGDDYLIVASYGGSDTHPLWYLNLQDNPDVRLRVGTERFAARAETLSAADKARVWDSLVELFPNYAEYQKKTSRDIPVVRLTRTDG